MLFRASKKIKADKSCIETNHLGLKFLLYKEVISFKSCEWHTAYIDRNKLQVSNRDLAETCGRSLTNI